MRTHELRRRFLDYFTERGHTLLPSGSLVPPDWDTSVLITTARVLSEDIAAWQDLYGRKRLTLPA